ncbi:MAG: shikimate dehydrogenase [Gemmatimonadales bacterium]|nr:shikimate dehydrogenase [Gemmatimonadales bacterium]
MISGATRVYALLGDPVAHSLSPFMHNAAFRALGLKAVYVALRCSSEDLAGLMHALGRAGGGGNITVPHKEAAALALGHRDGLVEATGACNTFWLENDRVAGDNTDVDGLLAALDALDPPDGPWLIAGTGGSARAAAAAAIRRGASIAVRSRSDTRRKAFEIWAGRSGASLAPARECRVILNTTPLGLSAGDASPPGRESAPDASVALDLVYSPGETAWVRDLRAAGLRAADGRTMLVAQGALALERWFPGVDAPTEIMRAAVDAALR